MLSIERIVDAASRRAQELAAQVAVLWCEVHGDRDACRAELARRVRGSAIVGVVLRTSGFTNANELQADVVRMLEANRSLFEGHSEEIMEAEGVVVVVLSRTPLRVPQGASPATLPLWFPVFAGACVEVEIEDVTHQTRVPVNAPEARVDDLCEKLYELERALVSRLRTVVDIDHRRGCALAAAWEVAPNETYAQVLSEAWQFVENVKNPRAYRPSARAAKSACGRLIRLASRSTPDRLGKGAEALASALGVIGESSPNVPESLFGILARPATRDAPRRRFGRNLITAIYGSAQLITAAAHADDYGKYAVLLVQHVSLDLRQNLAELAHVVGALD